MTEITILENLPTAAEVYASGAAESLIDKIKKEAKSFVSDISTEKGRKEVASLAYRIAKAKTALDGMGKELVDDWKKQASSVDKERKRIRDELDALKEEVRAPLTAFEDAEKNRIAEAESFISALNLMQSVNSSSSSEEIQDLILKVQEFKIDYDWREFYVRAEHTRKNTIDILNRTLSDKKDQEEKEKRLAELEAAEIERKNKEAEERRIKEENERIESAAEKARQEEVERQKKENDRLEKERQDALDAAAASEQKRIDSEKQAEQDKKVAADKAAADAIAAVEKHKKEEAAKQAEIDRQAEERAKNLEHKKKINNEILEAMNAVWDLAVVNDQDALRAIVKSIAIGQIPHISIKY